MLSDEQIDKLECESSGLVMGDGRHRDASDLFDQARDAIALRAQVGKLAEALGRAVNHIPTPHPESYLYRKSYADELVAEFRAVLDTTAAQAGEELAALRAQVRDTENWIKFKSALMGMFPPDGDGDALPLEPSGATTRLGTKLCWMGAYIEGFGRASVAGKMKALRARVAELAADDLTHREQIAELESLPATKRAQAAIALAKRIANGPGGGPSYAVNEIEDYLAACPQVAGEGKEDAP